MSRLAFGAALFASCLCLCVVQGAPSSFRPTSDIIAAFSHDGFDLLHNATYNGFRGFTARSRNVTLLSTGAHKVAHYVEGDAYSMGYLSGLLMEPQADVMVTTYIDHFVMSLISFELDKKLTASPEWHGLYAKFTDFLGEFLTTHANKAWAADLAKGVFPNELVTEMHGLEAGCLAANPNTNVTYERLITLNFGMDWLSVTLFSGALENLLVAHAAAVGAPPALRAAIATLVPGDVALPQYCDAFAASGPATASGTGSFFARDFQLATSEVFQDYQTSVVFVPNDGRRPLVAALAPGMVGSLTALNADGVAMGVDTIRSAAGTPESPGLNSLLLIRSSIHNSSTTEELVDVVSRAPRGCPFLYPASDAAGTGVIMEASAYNASATPPDALAHVKNDALRAALPTNEEVQALSHPDYRHGLYVRHMNTTVPAEFMTYNPALFKLANVTLDPTSSEATGHFFKTYTEEVAVWKKLHSSYFSPSRAPNNTIIVSNIALTPQLRLTEMNFFSDLFPGEAMQFRYDSLNDLLRAHWGSIDLDVAKYIITFLSPDRIPGYWHDYLNPDNVMSAAIQGILVACDLQEKVFEVKGGYWADGWLRISLSNYV